jgi:hypothetical protein
VRPATIPGSVRIDAAPARSAERASTWTARDRFPSASTVGGDLGERRLAHRFPTVCRHGRGHRFKPCRATSKALTSRNAGQFAVWGPFRGRRELFTAPDRGRRPEVLRGQLAQARARMARLALSQTLLEHALRCRHLDYQSCPHFQAMVLAPLDGWTWPRPWTTTDPEGYGCSAPPGTARWTAWGRARRWPRRVTRSRCNRWQRRSTRHCLPPNPVCDG